MLKYVKSIISAPASHHGAHTNLSAHSLSLFHISPWSAWTSRSQFFVSHWERKPQC